MIETEVNSNYSNIFKPQVSFVLLSICTCKRPKMLENSLLSTNLLNLPNGINVELLVVDNDADRSAKAIVDDVASKLQLKLHYEVEPQRGISNARNKVLESAVNIGASHILFFDDDELLTPDVLLEHIKLYQNTDNAYIVSGPTPNKFDDKYPSYIKKHMVFKQKTTKKTGLIRDNCAAGNVFFPVSVAKDFGLRFSSEYVFMGGEDGDFFSKASKLGFTIVWCNEAIIEEVVPQARTTISYILKKCYYNGYAGAYAKFKSNKKCSKKIIYVLKTILVLFVNSLTLLPSLLLGLTGFFNTLGTMSRTFGKICGAIKDEPYNFYEVIYGE